jgi:uncharacterized protein DUF4386
MTDQKPSALPMLAGVAFVVLAIAAFSVGGETPSMDDSAQKVIDFYKDNKDREYIAAFLLIYSVPFGAIFVAHLHSLLRWSSPRKAWATMAAIGGGALVAGFLGAAAIHLAVTEAVDKDFAPDSVRAISALDIDSWPLLAGPMFVLLIGAGAALLASTTMPRWLGWAGLVIGILGFTPAGFFMFLASGLWILATSIVAYSRLRAPDGGDPPAAAPPPAAPAV